MHKQSQVQIQVARHPADRKAPRRKPRNPPPPYRRPPPSAAQKHHRPGASLAGHESIFLCDFPVQLGVPGPAIFWGLRPSTPLGLRWPAAAAVTYPAGQSIKQHINEQTRRLNPSAGQPQSRVRYLQQKCSAQSVR